MVLTVLEVIAVFLGLLWWSWGWFWCRGGAHKILGEGMDSILG